MNSDFSADSLCMCCMSTKNSDGICLNCGFDETKYQPSPHHLPVRTILNGKYLVGRVLGEGGFGITYLGWDLNLDLKIAIKEFYPTGFVTRENTTTNTVTPFTGEKNEFFQSGRDKFVDEAKRLAKFYSLPGIVSIKDFFLENSTAYIVMEYVDGETFKLYLARMGGKVPAAMMFELMKPLMKSLIEIHKAGIIHRDISPDNIMLTKEGYVKLLDFGAARDFADSGNRSLSVMLKPGYAPEEQYRSKGIQGPWTDIYSLCATMYKAITGVTPDESSERIRLDELKKPSELGIEISLMQEQVLMKGMAVLQENRYLSISELSSELYDTANQEIASTVAIYDCDITSYENVDPSECKSNVELNTELKEESIGELSVISNSETKEETYQEYWKRISELEGKPQIPETSKKSTYGVISTVAIAILACILIGVYSSNESLQSDYEELDSSYYQRNSEYNQLKSDYDQKIIDYDQLNGDYSYMKSEYDKANSEAVYMKSNYDQQLEFRERISKVIPVLIEDIKISNIRDGGDVISEGTEFSSYDVRYIQCEFTSTLISETDTINEQIMTKLINPYGNVISYSDGSSPSGYTASASLGYGSFSIGNGEGNGSLNQNYGSYKIEFWYKDIKLTEVGFTVY